MTIPRKNSQFQKRPPPHGNGVDMRGMLSLVTMLVSLAALTLSMGGAAKFTIDIFGDGLVDSLDGLFVKIIVLGIAFFFGWVVGLSSIRVFGNLVYSFIIQIYAWACLFAVSILYMEIILKLYLHEYDMLHFWAYLLMLLGGLFVLICLHLLIEDHDLRPFAIPLLVISVIHLFVIIISYVFVEHPSGLNLLGDLTIFAVMISISGLMLAHLGFLAPTREWINEMFSSENKEEAEIE